MEHIFPTVMLKGPVWPSLFCAREFAELHDWVQQAKGLMLGMGYVVDVAWSSRFIRILEFPAGTPDVSIVILFFPIVVCIEFSVLVELVLCICVVQ